MVPSLAIIMILRSMKVPVMDQSLIELKLKEVQAENLQLFPPKVGKLK
jgi:hypothetical protein